MSIAPLEPLADDPAETIRQNAQVLIIDDEQSSRMILSEFFTQNGCNVTTSVNGQEGIEQVRGKHFDMIMLDINMPVMSGTDALPRILDLDPDVRVIIMTARASYESKVETREMGAYDYIVKPVTIDKLKEIAEKAIPERRSDQATGRGGYEKISIDYSTLDRETAYAIPERMARAFCVVVLSRNGNTLQVAMSDPYDIVAIDTLQTHTGGDILPIHAEREEIIRAIEELYEEQIDVDQTLVDLVTVQEEEDPEEENKTDDVLRVEADDAPVVQLVNLILHRAVESGASDIHIEPGEKTVTVRLRIDGVMQNIKAPPKSLFPSVVSRVKIIGGMDIAERRLPQDGRARISFRTKQVDLRINTLPSVHGESVVMRLLDKASLSSDISQLGLDEFHQNLLLEGITKPHGMVYVTGPTGSGKTTTLYSCIQHLNSYERKIITVEEPVEYEIAGIIQVPVRPDIDLTFAESLRAILRQDPDVIMVGETRDSETSEIAVRAALTGHLVFSTLHTNDAPSSVTRLVDLGIEPYLIGSSLNLIIAQRLVRRICGECKTESEVTPQMSERFARNTDLTVPDALYKGAGCTACNGTGYHGRVAIHEFLPVTPEIRQVITKGADEVRLKEALQAMGCDSLVTSGLKKAGQGLTTLDEVLRIAMSD